MPFSRTKPSIRDHRTLGRIPGLEMDDTIELPGPPARAFLASERYCRKGVVETRQTINGIYLVQTVDWFLEFAPTDDQDEHHMQEFWALVRDETGIDHERLSPSNVERLYNVLQDMRMSFRGKYQDKYPQGMTDEQTFFLKLLDATRGRMFSGHSRFQLHYGLRRDDNFGERMASRVLQWRVRVQEPQKILLEFPQIAHDVLPVEKQDADFKKMAEKFNLRFNKASAKTTVQIADDDDAMFYTEGPSGTPMADKLDNLSLKLDNLKLDLGQKTRKDTAIKARFEVIGHRMVDCIHNMREDVDQMAQAVDTVQGKLEDIEKTLSKLAVDMGNTKSQVSLMFCSGKRSAKSHQ